MIVKCRFCGNPDSKVIDSRPTEDGLKIRRRRECIGCNARFTTYEMIETVPIMVAKKNNTLQPFDREKILGGLIHACIKRPVSLENMETIISNIEHFCENEMLSEITSTQIGDIVLKQLKEYDEIAYIRFASVYRDFTDTQSFVNELALLAKNNSDT